MAITKETRIIRPVFENIPKELSGLSHWVLWKSEYRDGKYTKIPYTVKEEKAKTNIRATWTTLEEVRVAYERGGFDGIGFVFTSEDPFVGIDLDGHAIDGEAVTKEAQALRNYSYTEVSPSGTGLHIIFKGKLPEWCNKKNTALKMEIYEAGRFFTFTGVSIGADLISDQQYVLENIAERYFKKKKNTPSTEGGRPSFATDVSDKQLLDIMFKAKNKKEIAELWNGDISNNNNDHSSADLALCNHLSFYTGKDEKRIDSLFRQSKLYRPKWDEKRGHNTYGQMTIEKAILKTNNIYSPSIISQKKKQSYEKTDEQKPYFDGKTFIPKRLADEILSELPIVYDGNHLYVYRGGVYRRDQTNIIGKMALEKLDEDFRSSRLNEVKVYIENSRRISPDDFNRDTRFINLKNGLYDRKMKKLMPHKADFLSNTQLPVKYNPAATCPEIENFFLTVAPNDTMDMIAEWFGYSMIPTTRYEKAVMLTGEGSNGKSKFIDLYQHFIGKENMSSVPLQDLEHNRFKLAQIYGKLANVFADIPTTALEKSSIFKTVVSGDRVSAEYKGTDSFDFTPYARLMFSANELPRSADLTEGFFRRWLIIPFLNKFGKGGQKADPNIMDKLTTEQELSGLLNLALEGLERLEKQGHFTANKTTDEAVEQYKKEIDNVETFLEECCIVKDDAFTDKQRMYDEYSRWCFESGYKALGKYKFYNRIENKTSAVDYRPKGGKRYYKGIALLTDNR